MILSIVVLTGYAGQISLAQWAFAGIGALIAGRLVRAGTPVEVAFVLGVALTVPVGFVFAVPALRTRGVNLAVVTRALGFIVSEVVFANPNYLGDVLDGGTRVGTIELFGVPVDAFDHPHAWAVVNLIAFVLLALIVANLRRSRTGRRLIAVRSNERAAASLGISVFGVKLFAFALSAAIAAVAGILVGFRSQNIQYGGFNVFESITSLGAAVIGGLGYVLGAAFGALMAIGGIGTLVVEGAVGEDHDWDRVVGALLLFAVLILQPNGVAHLVTRIRRRRAAGRASSRSGERVLPDVPLEAVAGATLSIRDLTVRYGTATVVDGLSLVVRPGEVVGLIGPNGAGKTTVIDAGKSTTLLALAGELAPRSGEVLVDGVVTTAPMHVRCRRGEMSFVPQERSVIMNMSVADNLRLAGVSPIDAFGRFPALEPIMQRTAGLCSGGEQQMLALAAALGRGARILLIDELSLGLAPLVVDELLATIRRAADRHRLAVLLVEQHVRQAIAIADRVHLMERGRIALAGTAAEMERRVDRIETAYLAGPTG